MVPREESAHDRRSEGSRPRLMAVWRALALTAVVAAWLGVGAVGGQAQGALSSVQQNDAASFLPRSAESTRAREAAMAFTDVSALPLLIAVEARQAGDPGTARPEVTAWRWAQLESLSESLPEVAVGAVTIGDLLVSPITVLASQDGQAAMIALALEQGAVADSLEDGLTELVEAVRAELGSHLVDLSGRDPVSVWVTGPAAFTADLTGAFAGIDGVLLVVALAVVLGVLALVYRAPALAFIVILTPVFALAGAAWVIYPLAENGALDLNGQSQGILSILVVGAATDYSLLLVARYREELARFDSPWLAMRRAWRASIEPISASAGTVIAGLLCLLLSDLSSNASLGPIAAIGIVAAWLAALTLLPALLLAPGRFARAVFWPRVPRLATDSRPESAEATRSADPDAMEQPSAPSLGLWHRVAEFVTRHDRRVWIVTALGLAALTAFLPTLRASGVSDDEILLGAADSATGSQVVARHFPAGAVQPLHVITAVEDLDAVTAVLATAPGVESAAPVTDGPPADVEAGTGTGGPEPAGPPQPREVEGRVLIEVTTTAAAQSQEALAVAADIREALAEANLEVLVGGVAAERLDSQLTSARDLRVIVPVVLTVILVMLILLLRAIVAPLVLLAANVLSFGAGLGLAAIVFNRVLRFPGADPVVPLFGFVFLVALGIDYTIFLMTRVREEAFTDGTRTAVRTGLAVTGGVITSAGVVLAATFAALAVIPLLFMAQIAFIVAAGVLIDTFIVRTLLVPGVVHDLGRPTWWPWTARIPADQPR